MVPTYSFLNEDRVRNQTIYDTFKIKSDSYNKQCREAAIQLIVVLC